MYEGLGFGKKKLINEIILANWGIKDITEKKNYNYNEILFIIQEMMEQEGKAYFEGKGHASIMHGFNIFRNFVQLLLYRNIANYDSMILITSEKGTGKSSAAIMVARYWCKLLGIKFSPERHIAYNNADVMRKIDNLNKFEPIICLPGNTYIRIRCNNYEYNETIKNLVGRNNFEVLTYNISNDIFEWKKPEKVILTKEEKVDTIELENGIKIQATSNHLFLTKEGKYKRVDELTENDELVLNTKKCKVCNKEYFNQFQYSITCSKECENKNRKSIVYSKKYPEKSSKWFKEYWRKKTQDPIFRMKHNIHTRMSGVVRNYNENYNKESSYIKLLGCSPKQLREHIEKQFQPGMSWENYGVGKNKWSVDHIVGVNKIDIRDKEQIRKCYHYMNLQPLWTIENSRKGSLDRWNK